MELHTPNPSKEDTLLKGTGILHALVLREQNEALEYPWGLTPKLHQARLMSEHRISVPQTFENLLQGLEWIQAHGGAILFRSEHPDDGKINARSGLLSSIRISYTKDSKTGDRFFYISGYGALSTKYEVCHYVLKKFIPIQKEQAKNHGYDEKRLSFSTWEYIHGDNYTVVEDKSIPGRYFIHPVGTIRYELSDNTRCLTSLQAQGVDQELIQLYKTVQATMKFGKSPIIEIQMKYSQNEKGEWVKDSPYFLQALQTSDGENHNWELTRPLEKDEYEALLVRGSTPPGGLELDLDIIDICTEKQEYGGFVINTMGLSDGSKRGFTETVISDHPDRVCIVALDQYSRACSSSPYMNDILQDHLGVSFFHKPKLSIVLPASVFFDRTGIGVQERFQKYRRDEEFSFSRNGYAKVRVLSDGKRAYVKIITSFPIPNIIP